MDFLFINLLFKTVCLLFFVLLLALLKRKEAVAEPHASFMSLSIKEIMLNLCINQMLLVV